MYKVKIPLHGGIFILIRNNSETYLLEQFELLARSVRFYGFMSIKYLYVAKLFVGYAEDSNIAKFGQERLYTLNVYCGILHAGAMADIDRKLEHGESVTAQILTKKRVSLFVFLGVGGQVEKYKYPHNSVFAKSVHGIDIYNSETYFGNVYQAVRHASIKVLDMRCGATLR